MKKVMISQPMKDKTEEEIKKTREEAVKYLESQGYEVINTYFEDEWENAKDLPNPALYFLGKSIQEMSKCDSIFFARGWAIARGCRVERMAAILYNLEILTED